MGARLTLEVIEDLVLKNEDVFVFVLLFHFNGDVLPQYFVVCLVNETYMWSKVNQGLCCLLKVPWPSF